MITISGSGFGNSVTVTVDGNACSLISTSYDEIVCSTPAGVRSSDEQSTTVHKIRKRKKLPFFFLLYFYFTGMSNTCCYIRKNKHNLTHVFNDTVAVQ